MKARRPVPAAIARSAAAHPGAQALAHLPRRHGLRGIAAGHRRARVRARRAAHRAGAVPAVRRQPDARARGPRQARAGPPGPRRAEEGRLRPVDLARRRARAVSDPRGARGARDAARRSPLRARGAPGLRDALPRDQGPRGQGDPLPRCGALGEEFHAVVLKRAGNARLLEALEQIREQIRPVWTMAIVAPRRVQGLVHEHLSIIDALKRPDARARRAAHGPARAPRTRHDLPAARLTAPADTGRGGPTMSQIEPVPHPARERRQRPAQPHEPLHREVGRAAS